METQVQNQPLLTKMPFIGNLENTFKLDAYLNTPEGAKKYKSYDAAYKTFSAVKKWAPWLFAVIVVVFLVGRNYSLIIL